MAKDNFYELSEGAPPPDPSSLISASNYGMTRPFYVEPVMVDERVKVINHEVLALTPSTDNDGEYSHGGTIYWNDFMEIRAKCSFDTILRSPGE